jgi:hypothetical protein
VDNHYAWAQKYPPCSGFWTDSHRDNTQQESSALTGSFGGFHPHRKPSYTHRPENQHRCTGCRGL